MSSPTVTQTAGALLHRIVYPKGADPATIQAQNQTTNVAAKTAVVVNDPDGGLPTWVPTTPGGLNMVALGVCGWLVWAMARRQNRADQLNHAEREANHAAWVALTEDYRKTRTEDRVERKQLMDALIAANTNALALAQAHTSNGALGRQLDQLKETNVQLHRQLDQANAMIRAANGGHNPLPLPPA